MSLFRKLFGSKTLSTRATRFERYYGNVLHRGAGYPTADEARRDLAQYERNVHPFGWPM